MKNNLKLSVASSIQSIRTSLNISQEELASRAELDRTYISGVERGVRNITLDSLERIIGSLEMTTDEFLQKVIDEL